MTAGEQSQTPKEIASSRVQTGPRGARFGLVVGALGAAPLLASCDGVQSALDPAGREAEQIARLYWWMVGGGTTVWLAVMGLGAYAIRVQPTPGDGRKLRAMIVGGGAVVPTVVLGALLLFGLRMLASQLTPAPEGALRIEVTGEQWWWRIRYLRPDGDPIELANEVWLPAGEPVEFILRSSDVIHSFWIPSLGGKRDMIPGRETRLVLTPAKTGFFRGVCAEYCGTSHALMAFYVKVVGKDEFSAWLSGQATSAQAPSNTAEAHGRELFSAHGCGACHVIRGTQAIASIGPDLTHAGSRQSLSAGILTNQAEMFERWLSRPQTIKPGALMPAFDMLPAEDRQAIAVYLESLK